MVFVLPLSALSFKKVKFHCKLFFKEKERLLISDYSFTEQNSVCSCSL